jgi:hypothetical protein
MDDSNAKKFQKDLNGGLVGLVLLAVLDRSTEDLYGYEIAKRLASANEGTSIFKEGTLYPVLRALGPRVADQPDRPFLLGTASPLLPDHRSGAGGSRRVESHLAEHGEFRRSFHCMRISP